MKIAIFPGSFKPPHAGHKLLVDKLLEDKSIDKVYIVISNKPRPLEDVSGKENILEVLKKNGIKVDPGISKKQLDKIYNEAIRSCMVPCIDSNQSKKIWDIYLKNIAGGSESKKNGDGKHLDKVKISVTPVPILTARQIAERALKKGDVLVLVKSEKNAPNSRFDIFQDLKKKGIKLDYLTLDSYKNRDRVLSATNMREMIRKKDRKTLGRFLPKELNKKDRDEVMKILLG